jgi:FKBP-type peptidyl-prolyl cis-trans isomerase FkpA/FKBP-type peptidyl-prolyl cis-trans isomerase FklB
MKSLFRSALVAVTLACAVPAIAFAQAPAPAKKKPAAPLTEKQKVSIMIAMDVARSLDPIKEEIDLPTFARALAMSFNGKSTGLSDKEAEAIRAEFSKSIQAKLAARQEAQAKKHLAAGEAFLKANKAKPGVHATASGLQYQVLRAGPGPKPAETDTVRVHYRGTLLDGKEFDSSYANGGQPVEFALNQVIPGWREGLALMPVGSKYKFWIPSSLAYGPNGPPQIGPNAMLTFEVDLQAIVK